MINELKFTVNKIETCFSQVKELGKSRFEEYEKQRESARKKLEVLNENSQEWFVAKENYDYWRGRCDAQREVNGWLRQLGEL